MEALRYIIAIDIILTHAEIILPRYQLELNIEVIFPRCTEINPTKWSIQIWTNMCGIRQFNEQKRGRIGAKFKSNSH